LAGTLPAADWRLFRSGNIDVVTDGKDAVARQALNSLDQVRYLTARWLAKTEVDAVLGVRMVVSTGVPPRPWFLCRDGYLASGLAPVTLRGYATLLLEGNAQRLPAFAEDGMLDVLAQLSADGPRITLGVPAQPTKTWAGMFYLLTSEDYAGRMRVFLSNLQQDAPIDTASRNSLGKPWAEIEKEMDAYWTARRFQPAQLSGAPIAPERQYRERPMDQADAARHAADAKRGTPPPVAELAEDARPESKNAVALVAAGDAEPSTRIAREMFERAAELAPRWAEPHVKLAALESDLARRIPRLKKALTLRPRDALLWETLAEAQTQGQLFNDAAVSYRNAERAAATEEERASIERRRREYEQSKLDLVAAAKKKEAEEKARELEQLKNEALARVRAAEAKANAQLQASAPKSNASGAAPVNWDQLNGGKQPDGKLEGKIERVDCVGNQTRISVRAGTKLVRLNAEPSRLVLAGAGEMKLACGIQRPAREATIEYFVGADAKAGTAGEAARIEFRN